MTPMPYDPGDPKYERVRQVVQQHSREHLIRTLRTDDLPLLREQAALALGAFTGREVDDALCEALTDPDPRTRHAAAETLLNTCRERGLRRLSQVAEHIDWSVLIRRLVSQTDADPADLRPEEWLWPRSLSLVGGPALTALCSELARPHPETRRIVQTALTYIGEPAIELVEQTLNGSISEARYAAAQVLGSMGSPRAILALRKCIEGVDPYAALSTELTGLVAAMALSGSGPAAYPTLGDLLSSGNMKVRDLTASALCISPHPGGEETLKALGAVALPALCEKLSRGSEKVREGAARGLGILGLREALPILRARLPRLGVGGERDRNVLAAIREAIRRIESATQETSGRPRAVRDLPIDPAGRPRSAGEGCSHRESEE